jgi:hypothetical protein
MAREKQNDSRNGSETETIEVKGEKRKKAVLAQGGRISGRGSYRRTELGGGGETAVSA